MSKNKHTVALIANGAMHDYQTIGELVKTYQEVVAVDGGCNHCVQMGILPDLIVGDCDSIDAVAQQRFSAVPQLRFPVEKDESDLELALQSTYTPEIDKITIFGGLEKRTDHFLANLHLIRRYPNKVYFESETELIFCTDTSIEIPCTPGNVVSFIQLGDPAAGISSEGLKWELHDATFSKYFFSMSNVCLTDRIRLSITQGDLICILQK